MSQYQFHLILRFFYQYSCDIFILFKKGKIHGYILKTDIESILSDLSAIHNAEDKLPMKQFENTENLIQIFHRYSILHENRKVIPSLDSNLQFSSFWPMDELIKSFESVPSVQEWKPENPAQAPRAHKKEEESAHKTLSIEIETSYSGWKKNSEKQIVKNKKPPKEAISSFENGTVEIKKKEDSNGTSNSEQQEKTTPSISFENSMALFTLETLPIPMLAVDKKGNVIFHNEEWETIYKTIKNQHSIVDLLNKTKDEMARLAYEGSFQKNSIITNIVFDKDDISYQMQSKSIIGHSSLTSPGYLFWIEKVIVKKADQPLLRENIEESNELKSGNKGGYLGSTLPEILEKEEKKVLSWAYEEAGKSFSNAAMLLGIPRQTFTYRYKKYFSS